MRITDEHYRHPECYTCSECGLNLRMRGHFWVGDVMYCEKHAKQRYQGPGSSPQAIVSPRPWVCHSTPALLPTWSAARLPEAPPHLTQLQTLGWDMGRKLANDIERMLFWSHLTIFYNIMIHFFAYLIIVWQAGLCSYGRPSSLCLFRLFFSFNDAQLPWTWATSPCTKTEITEHQLAPPL